MAIAGLLLIALTIVISSWARDEYLVWRVWGDVRRWDNVGIVDSERLVLRHVDTITPIVERRGGRAEHHFLAAKLHEWAAHLQRLSPRAAARQLELAEHHLHLALAKRPLWGRAWGALLVNGAQRHGGWNDVVAERLAVALRLGRYDLQTQLYLIHFAFTEWRGLPEPVQQELHAFLKRTMADGGKAGDYMRNAFRRPPFDSLYQSIRS